MKSTFTGAIRLVVTTAMVATLMTFLAPATPAAADLSDIPLTNWGVEGNAPARTNNWTSPVWAIEQIGNIMYVGGKMTTVRNGSEIHERRYIAAFEASTGRWLDWFVPEFNAPIYALRASEDGSRLFVGGEFSEVNGQDISGFVALDPLTGDIDDTWTTRFNGNNPTVIREAKYGPDGMLYVGGGFTSVRQGGTTFSTRNVVRLDPVTGVIDPTFQPVIASGSVWDFAFGAGRVYMVGFFKNVNGRSARGFVAVNGNDGSFIPGLATFTGNDPQDNDFMYGVAAANGLVWVGGEQHILFVLNEADLSRRYTHYTGSRSGDVLQGGGDFQDIEVVGDRVYASCHCWRDHLDASTGGLYNPRSNQTGPGRWDTVRSLIAYDATTGKRDHSFKPHMSGRSGVWAIDAHSTDGCLWVGGGITRTGFRTARGLSRLCDAAGPGPAAGPTVADPPTPLAFNYDFGTPTSPLASGTIGGERWRRTLAPGASWSDTVVRRDRTGNTLNDQQRDFVFASSSRTLRHPVENGVWRITVQMGDADFARADMSLRAEGTLINNNIDTAAGQIVYVGENATSNDLVSFDVLVVDGQLDLEFFDSGGDRTWTLNSLSMRLVGDPPPPPATVPACTSVVEGNDIRITWSATDNAERYVIRRSVDRLGLTELATVVSPDTTYLDTAVFDTQSYSYTVEATNVIGSSTPVSCGPDIGPPPPTAYNYDFGPNNSPVQTGTFNGEGWSNTLPPGVTWSGPVDSRNRSTNVLDALERDFVFGTSSRTLRHPVENGTWRITIQMGDADFGRADMSVRAEGTLINNNIDTARGQVVYVGENVTSNDPVSFDVLVDDNQLDLEFFDSGGESTWTLNRLSIELVGDTPPPPPPPAGDVVAPVSCTATQTSPTTYDVTWQAADNDGADRYIIRRSRNGGTYFWNGRVDPPGNTSTSNTVAGSTYAYRVEARNGASDFESTQCTVVPLEPANLVAPVSCTATQTSPTTYDVTWQAADNDGADRYIIRRSRDGGTFNWTGRVDPPGNTLTNNTVAAGSTYTYTVEARNGTNAETTTCTTITQ